MNKRPDLIADILMGAAYADNNLDGKELDKVKALMAELLGDDLSEAQAAHLEAFEPSKLDVTATVEQLELETEDEKRKLLELISAVHDADDVWDFDEDLYLRGVAAALGVKSDKFSDLSGEFEIDVIGETLGMQKPPPLPKK